MAKMKQAQDWPDAAGLVMIGVMIGGWIVWRMMIG